MKETRKVGRSIDSPVALGSSHQPNYGYLSATDSAIKIPYSDTPSATTSIFVHPSSRPTPRWATGTEPPAQADTVIAKGHDGALLTLVERCTKYVLIVKSNSKQAGPLATAATKVLRGRGLPTKTITFENGLEFARHESIGQALEAATYFAHPYHSWERGLNGNTNAGSPVRIDRSVHSESLSD